MDNQNTMPRIACFGTLIVDIITTKIHRIPSPGECALGSASIRLGGNTYSASINLKRLFQSSADVFCVGSIGNDEFGSMFEKALEKEGVEAEIQTSTTHGTSSNLIIQVSGEDRRYIFDDGANACTSGDDLLDKIERINPSILVFGEIPSIRLSGDPFKKILRQVARDKARMIALDTLVNESEDYGWMEREWENIDLIHCNIGEGRHITKEPEPKAMCKWFSDRGIKLSIVSDGEKGMHYSYGNQFGHARPYEAVELDATGAGDATLAGIIFGICEYASIADFKRGNIDWDCMRRIMQFGSACGSCAVRSIGCIGDISKQTVYDIINT